MRNQTLQSRCASRGGSPKAGRRLRVSMLGVQLVDMVNGDPLTTPDKPAELDDSIAASVLVQQILDFVGQLPEGHLVDPKVTKIVNKSRRVELTSQQTLALYYSTVFGRKTPKSYRNQRLAND